MRGLVLLLLPRFEGRYALAHCAADVDLVGGCGQQVLVQDAKERVESKFWIVCRCLETEKHVISRQRPCMCYVRRTQILSSYTTNCR